MPVLRRGARLDASTCDTPTGDGHPDRGAPGRGGHAPRRAAPGPGGRARAQPRLRRHARTATSPRSSASAAWRARPTPRACATLLPRREARLGRPRARARHARREFSAPPDWPRFRGPNGAASRTVGRCPRRSLRAARSGRWPCRTGTPRQCCSASGSTSRPSRATTCWCSASAEPTAASCGGARRRVRASRRSTSATRPPRRARPSTAIASSCSSPTTGSSPTTTRASELWRTPLGPVRQRLRHGRLADPGRRAGAARRATSRVARSSRRSTRRPAASAGALRAREALSGHATPVVL